MAALRPASARLAAPPHACACVCMGVSRVMGIAQLLPAARGNTFNSKSLQCVDQGALPGRPGLGIRSMGMLHWAPLLQGAEDDAPASDIQALRRQAMAAFGSNRISAAHDFYTFQARGLRARTGCEPALAQCLCLCLWSLVVCSGMDRWILGACLAELGVTYYMLPHTLTCCLILLLLAGEVRPAAAWWSS